jgi:hypothetical protein
MRRGSAAVLAAVPFSLSFLFGGLGADGASEALEGDESLRFAALDMIFDTVDLFGGMLAFSVALGV